jgi:hypothetical protein
MHKQVHAHIAAANASLRLNETAETKRWLAAATVKYRNWEWRYLHARSDASVGVIKFKNTTFSDIQSGWFSFGDWLTGWHD